MIFRRLTDLLAWWQDVGGHPAVFVQMPVPEGPSCAFFIVVVLLAPLDAFKAADAAIRNCVQRLRPRPDEALLARLRGAPGRYFTLERSVNSEDQQALQQGHFCEWTRDGEHRSSGWYLPSSREAFAEAVIRALAFGSTLPATASSNPRHKVITINAPLSPRPSA
jgi:hypothetical protein